ncbi:hypothetical protein [Aquipuribacter sp. MA13-13]|uniref:hypothetical protein n=1 Tax=Aquipuribacter sp. MA13-13 TaxID=3440840 RepID=UPI003EED78E7
MKRTDGSLTTVQAHRVVVRDGATTFEHRTRDSWHPELSVRNHDIDTVQRRVSEIDGRWTWVLEQPVEGRGLSPRP